MDQRYRVIATQKSTAWIVDLHKQDQFKCFFSRKLKPICGDYITLDASVSEYRIENILNRTNTFARADRNGRVQHIAANIDQMVIVIAVEPAPTRDIINRYLVAAEINQLKPLLLFNKSDLDHSTFDESMKSYHSLGYETFKCSAVDTQSLQSIESLFADKTSIMVGQSGVGKSSISQHILLDDSLKTGKLSGKTGKGAHTTSVTRLYKIKNTSGYLIDSPGVWEYGLWKMSALEIAEGFIEFSSYKGECKFSDCTHIHEPGCAIIHAVKNDDIQESRYQSYLRVVDSMKYWEHNG